MQPEWCRVALSYEKYNCQKGSEQEGTKHEARNTERGVRIGAG